MLDAREVYVVYDKQNQKVMDDTMDKVLKLFEEICVNKDCRTCRYRNVLLTEPPCYICRFYDCYIESGSCAGCVYGDLKENEGICAECDGYIHFETMPDCSECEDGECGLCPSYTKKDVSPVSEEEPESCSNCVNSECTADEYPCAVCEDGDNYIDIRKVKEEQTEKQSCHRCIHMGMDFDATTNEGECQDCENGSNFKQNARQIAFQTQVGGSHYKSLNVPSGFPDPAEFCIVHDLGGAETAIIKYVFRHSYKGGVEDLKKAKQYIEFLAACRYNEVI